MKIMTVFGTRPEAIKLAPVITELRKRGIPQVVCVTAQHRQMLDQMLSLFDITPDYDLDIMTDRQTIGDITSKALKGLEPVLTKENPDLVIVQGDTTTTLMGALAAFYHKVPVAHIEAGLRTPDKYNPFPEEMNRRLVSQVAEFHFAATKLAKENLLKSGVDESDIYVTGNTVIDSLLWTSALDMPFENKILRELNTSGKKIILITTHRRENLGDGMRAIFNSIHRLSSAHKDLLFVFPVHLNPQIREHAEEILGNRENVVMTEPISYPDISKLMKKCYMVMTDSGGIQEEAPSLGKPVLVLRSNTERPEGVSAGTAKLAGVDEDSIFHLANELITNKDTYNSMAHSVNPYGDGTSAKQIVDILSERLTNDKPLD